MATDDVNYIIGAGLGVTALLLVGTVGYLAIREHVPTEANLQEAYRDGQRAWQSGIGMSDSPYIQGTRLWSYWLAGYQNPHAKPGEYGSYERKRDWEA